MSQTDSYLTLCIEERSDEDYTQITNRLFVSYDDEQETYVVYGKRESLTQEFEQYFFRADKSTDMYRFFELVVGHASSCSYTLYNYNNMPFDLEGVDYFFMETNMNVEYELEAYDHMTLKKKKFTEMLHVLKNLYNCR